MNLCHNRYGKSAEFMVKCQQRLEFMRICRISVLMSLYQQYLQSKKIEKGITQMPNVKYTDSATFRCLENLKEGSLDISLIHTGKEHCPPGHICSTDFFRNVMSCRIEVCEKARKNDNKNGI